MLELVKPYFPSLFAWFDNKLDAAKAKPSPARRELAYDEVLGFLLDGEDSGGVELTLDDFISGAVKANRKKKLERLRKILEYGMKSELMRLDRLADEMRLRRATQLQWGKEVKLRSLQLHLLRYSNADPPPTHPGGWEALMQ
jgi:hypothetical protein